MRVPTAERGIWTTAELYRAQVESMTPVEYATYIDRIAKEVGFEPKVVIRRQISNIPVGENVFRALTPDAFKIWKSCMRHYAKGERELVGRIVDPATS